MDTHHDPPPDIGPPDIAPHEVVIDTLIGEGTFGKVMSGKCRQKPVAIKVLNKQTFDPKTLEAFRKEVAIASRLYHPNIALFMGACTQPGHCMIVTELVAKGDLETMLHSPSVTLSLTLRMKMARDAAHGMLWLHGSQPKLIHRDLKTSNLLVDENMRVKVCDFGLSQILPTETGSTRDAKSAKGTPLWMAPEVMMFKDFNEKADVYSFGIVLWEIVTRREPFEQYKSFTEFRNAVCRLHVRPEVPAGIPERLAHLMQACWAPEPEARPDFAAIGTELELVIIETAIRDDFCRQFWARHFLGMDPVPWNAFFPNFFVDLGVPTDAVQALMNSTAEEAQAADDADLTQLHLFKCCVEALVTETNRDSGELEVRLELFGHAIDCFSPVTDASTLNHMANLLVETWFHGNLSAQDAMTRLRNFPAGTYLVRFSESEVGAYTISIQTETNSTKHQRIKHVPGRGFFLGNAEYSSLQEIVARAAAKLNLMAPCPGSPFQQIFLENNAGGYIDIKYDDM